MSQPVRVALSRVRRRQLRLGALLGVAMIAPWAGCRSQTPRTDGIRTVRLTDRAGYVEFVARRREREQEPKTGGQESRSKETVFEEGVRLDTEGFVYHPNLVEFALGGLFGLIQEDFEDDVGGRTRSSRDSGTLLEFDFEARFLRRKKYPLTVFGHRRRTLSPRPFLSSLETTTTEYGLTWQYVSDKTPTSLAFNHTDVQFDSLREEDDRRQQSTLLRFETGYHFNDYNVLSFGYARESIKQDPYDIDYDTDNLTLAHYLMFGKRKQHRLDSELRYFSQRGTVELERGELRETLRFKHSDTLGSWYRFEMIDRTQGSFAGGPPVKERSYYLSGTLEHRLYKSLVSQIGGFVQTQDFDGGAEIDRYGSQVNLNYRKQNRWGVLAANYGVALQRTDRAGGDQQLPVIDESHTFHDPEPIILTDAGIDVSSVTITSEDGTQFYQENRDYKVHYFADRIEIHRVPTGWITAGETVFIDYVISMVGSFTLNTTRQHFGIRQNFSFGLSPYYRLEWQDQTISPKSAAGTMPEDITAQVVGLEYRRESLRLSAEYEKHDSTINPFDAVRLGASYTHHFKFGATGSLGVRWTEVSHETPNERETTYAAVEGRYRHPITERLFVEGAVLYRTEEDTLSGDDEGIDIDLSLEWHIRETEIKIACEFGNYEDDFARTDSSALYMQVRRRF